MNEVHLNIADVKTAQTKSKKFQNPDWTADGEERATVSLAELKTLWINTGTLCNIECVNCYIESSPKNDRLAYITAAEAAAYLDEIGAGNFGTAEIGFTGGEPFLNPEILEMLEDTLGRGLEALVLTNAMQPMQRPRIQKGLLELKKRFGDQLTLRVSLDHYTQELHETERGPDSWDRTLQGLDWLSKHGFKIAIAGRTCWGEDEDKARAGYAELIEKHKWGIDAHCKSELVLFPEMDEAEEVPEITTRCWDLVGVNPGDMMCATSRMVVKRKGAEKPTVLPCTLIPFNEAFDMGTTLTEAAQADGGMFREGTVKLCHPHCAKFCVLGGGSCSVSE